ncbi:MAG: hypothetical protein ABIH99_00820, partial [Candidatus Micrarchaeota archaeon]
AEQYMQKMVESYSKKVGEQEYEGVKMYSYEFAFCEKADGKKLANLTLEIFESMLDESLESYGTQINREDYLENFSKSFTEVCSKNKPSEVQAWYAVLDDSAVASGNEFSLKKVIDVKNGKMRSAWQNASISKLAENLNLDGWLVIMLPIPEISEEQAESLKSGALSFKWLAHTRAIGLSFEKESKELEVKIVAVAETEKDANKISDFFGGAVQIGKGFTREGSALEALISGTSVEAKGNVAILEWKTSTEEVNAAWDEYMEQYERDLKSRVGNATVTWSTE